jgi:predicted DCC family thiol-disulfide oxidoreductase YuxK
MVSLADPGRPVLVFDGDCAFCTTSARTAQRWARLEHVEPWQFLDLDALGLTVEECTTAVQWVDEAGNAAAAEHAVIAACRHAGGLWGVVGRATAVPGIRQLAGLGYRVVAKYRYKLPGGTPACRLG